MILATDIQNSNWSFSTDAFGAAVTGIHEVNQTIGIILSTRKGTDPFRPNFGSDIWDYIDSPINTAGPNISRAIIEALERWETRIKIVSVDYTYQPQQNTSDVVPAGLIFNIVWQLIGGTGQELVNLVLGVNSDNQNVIFVLGTEDSKAVATQDGSLIKL